MNRGIVLAWITGEIIVIYRGAWKEKRPPWPSELLLSSLVFMALAGVAEKKELAPAASLAAWGFVIAAYLNLFNPTTLGGVGSTSSTSSASTPSAGGTTGVGPEK
jgi:hypothetical protein